MSTSTSNQKAADASTPLATTFRTNRPRQRVLQDYLLIWIDDNINKPHQASQDILRQLSAIQSSLEIFTQRDQCIDFLTDIEDVKIFLIAADAIVQQIAPLIHDVPQLHEIYVISHEPLSHEQWDKEWMKVKGIYTTIPTLCQALHLSIGQCNPDSIAMSFFTVDEVASVRNLNQLEPSFMYTQIFKETLLGMKHDENSVKNFVDFCRADKHNTSSTIDKFEKEYHQEQAIWWYTSPTFIYSQLNHALRTLQGDTIINMGFFIRDLHRQIKQLHQQQVSDHIGESFTVYRGQGLSVTDFGKLQKTKDGLISFNNFLSTSTNRDVPYIYAESSSTKKDMVGILFVMSIDPTVKSSPFADIRDVSYFQTEEEILFSMHTVFRIGNIQELEGHDRLYQVELQLTADDDEQLRLLTKYIEEEVASDTEWERLANLFYQISQFHKAEELYLALLEQASNDHKRAYYCHQLGLVKIEQGDSRSAIEYYKETLALRQKSLSENHHSLAVSYNNNGLVYHQMGEYAKALSFYEKALEIYQKSLPQNHHSLATTYNNIGQAYWQMGEYAKALSFHEKALEIYQQCLPQNHHLFATSYNNIGLVYHQMGEYAKALSFYEKALEIYQKSLPENHPLLATSYNNIGQVYHQMGENAKALSVYEKALKIKQNSLPGNHSSLATSYNNIGLVYEAIGEYAKALSFHEKALEIYKKSLPENHPLLATSYNNIGAVHGHTGEYAKALSFYKKALEIKQKSLHENHPSLASSYNNIGQVYYQMGEYAEALYFYEKALEICQKSLPEDHPSLATSYNNIAQVYYDTGEYTKSLSYFERAQVIWQNALPPNQPQLKSVKESIEVVKRKL